MKGTEGAGKIKEESKKENVEDSFEKPKHGEPLDTTGKEDAVKPIKVESIETKEERMEEDEESEDDDDDGDTPSTLDDVYEALGEVTTPGSTCTAGVATSLPALPGLNVKGVGTVLLPVTDVTASALKAVAKQAPHGQGMETVLDTSARDTLQIDADQITLDHPCWNTSLRKLVDTAATSLGVAPSLVQPHLYKLLLYETGGFFKKHRDTEKEDGMFATLVIQLPSVFH
ncbi:expressed unknown protein [Seminavis robusta]|uniref:Prolyl 4-hydroxylase alpha subunit Fe(2+) 2OG dioxygenase domain-containing protein n=1 Tax=Seminavis robusta TaxID=568900 RepID=A0A9N8EHW0_9STRA|nr:expressed unknown protein [Seminavis robusta]|eukprot:Sro962_g225100.1 n/a (229) ;mRNA; f:13460-14146